MAKENSTNVSLVIVISDDEDEEESHPADSYRVMENSLQKAVIVIDEDDDNVKEEAHAVEPDEQDDCDSHHNSSSTKRTSPWEKLKINEHGIKRLKAMVKLTKLDVTSPIKIGNDSTETRDLKLKVKTEKEDVPTVPKSQTPGMGIFERLNTKWSDSNCVTNLFQESTFCNKRSKSTPPSSPSLTQSKLSAESFSPKKTRPMLHLYSRQEQPLHYATPLYCAVPLRKSVLVTRGKQQASPKTFTENQMNSLQALKEENFHKSILATVSSFMSHRRKPPPPLLFELLNTILLSKQTSCGTECFRILRQIQVLHPVVASQMVGQTITWEFVSMVAKLSGCTHVHSTDSNLKRNASMALSFLVSVMEEEVHVKKFSLVKTSAHRLLHVDKRSSNIHDVVQWIGQSLSQHNEQLDQFSCGQNFCPLYLLQKMLVLSLLVSERPEDGASRLADEMVMIYVELRSIQHKTLLLQSVQSHLLKTKLIEVIVSNCCPSHDDLEVKGISRMTLRQIVFIDFKRFPPANSSSIHDPDDHLDNKSSLSCNSTTYNTMINYEEFVMLLAYQLQSFVFCRKRSLMKNASTNLPRVLSVDDIEVLKDIDQEVLMLTCRLESLCSPSTLSTRTYQLLGLISSLKSFA